MKSGKLMQQLDHALAVTVPELMRQVGGRRSAGGMSEVPREDDASRRRRDDNE